MRQIIEVTQNATLRAGDFLLIENGRMSVLTQTVIGEATEVNEVEETTVPKDAPKKQRRRSKGNGVGMSFDPDNMQERRTKIFEVIHAKPGIKSREIIDELFGDDQKSLEQYKHRIYWDVRAMANEQLIEEQRDGRKAKFYPRKP